MRKPKSRLNEAQHRWVLDWWNALQENPSISTSHLSPELHATLGRAARAQIRRCTNIDELLQQPAVLLFARRLLQLNAEGNRIQDEAAYYERLAWITGVLVVVKTHLDEDKSLALDLGKSKTSNESARMSELRFQSMIRCTNMHLLLRHWRQAVQLNENKANVVRLADDLLAWQLDLTNQLKSHYSQGSRGIRFRWSCDYYFPSENII